MLSVLSILFFTFLVTYFLIPVLIDVSKIKHLFDDNLETRKIHIQRTPNLGGIAIYTALLLGSGILIKASLVPWFNYFIAGSFIIALIGVKDDLVGLDPMKKIVAQIAAAFIMAYMADIRITSFYGLAGIYELPLWLSVAFTMLVSIFLYNAMNLLDGIDCLATGIGVIACFTYAVCFYMMGNKGECLLALALGGALIAFLFYNYSPAKIFMGDSGSLTIGFILAILSVRFIELNKNGAVPAVRFHSAPAIAIGILIIPVYDTLRVFFLRLWLKRSPFKADNNHLHHRLVYLKFSHIQSSLILILINLVSIAMVFLLQKAGNMPLICGLLLLALCTNIILWTMKSKRKAAGRFHLQKAA
ncbi:MraY family glycosyltransferase [Sediminibacterium ginsengisoli]|uniref:UDP-N-acetylmuramyl pentapeptide phosphotransferase/UDP-N-acetylglucosamine-1-phosphate transferase n=1 Tax=Sediminibacterium ginsengisoli TaxID=413434 RepID=A0A1T4Q518_9BACT|nr:MraY family glycosyltransferase [Sediminibacterium ginsengisoli]SJZ98631.1 UDP-N-acetylmuramyl pentapeptide phosphotransferase/UDP-N-acetylglucosamine-1-phosphate transferase [Sediminibacterium ginsengisoli]